MNLLNKLSILLIAGLCTFSSGCEKAFQEDEPGSSNRETFEALWKACDENYSFFDYKNIDWDSVYNVYSPQVTNSINEVELFNLMFAMLNALEDGHVNLIAPFNISRYEFNQKGQDNYDERFVRDNYLSANYYQTGPFLHDGIAENQIGYVRYNSFTDEVSDYDMDLVLFRYSQTQGIIFDIRENGGGSMRNVFRILDRLANKKTLLYNSKIKTGKGHFDFSDNQPAYAEPSGSINFDKPIVILTDRGSFSASSFFTLGAKELSNITVIGDTTGGGLGAPSGGQLPNGWTYRMSVTQTISVAGENYENGVPPDITVNWSETDRSNGKDSVLERAIQEIL